MKNENLKEIAKEGCMPTGELINYLNYRELKKIAKQLKKLNKKGK